MVSYGMNQVLPRQRTPWRRAAPPAHVGLILIRHAERKAIEAGGSLRGEVKDELVAIVDEAVAVDRLVVADGKIAREAGGRAGRFSIDGDRLDPVNDVLHPQVRPDGLRDVERRPRISRLGAHVEEERAVGPEHPRGRRHPAVGPFEICRRRKRVLVAAVLNAQVIRRRRDDDIDALGGQLLEDLEAVRQVEAARRLARADALVRFE